MPPSPYRFTYRRHILWVLMFVRNVGKSLEIMWSSMIICNKTTHIRERLEAKDCL